MTCDYAKALKNQETWTNCEHIIIYIQMKNIIKQFLNKYKSRMPLRVYSIEYRIIGEGWKIKLLTAIGAIVIIRIERLRWKEHKNQKSNSNHLRVKKVAE